MANQLLLPHFDYACVVYDDLSEYLDEKLQTLQNQCIRFVFGVRKYEHISPYRRQLKWLTTKSRRKYLLGSLIYKILSTRQPIYLFELLEQYFSFPTRDLRSTGQKTFDIPFNKSKIFDKTFQYKAISLWNNLPKNVTDSETLNSFKNRLFKFLFENEKNN